MENAMNFRQRAEQFMIDVATRARPNTVHVYRSLLDARILPAIGGVELADVNNKAVKMLISRLTEAQLSPATINLAVTLVKQIVKSATDEEGNQLHPRTWNSTFMKVPKIDPDAQATPITSSQTLTEAVSRTRGEVAALAALIGGTGLRIGEALALHASDDGVNSFWDRHAGRIVVRATLVAGKVQLAPKTRAGKRVIDLDPRLNDFLQQTVGGVVGPLFKSSESTLRRRMEAVGIHGFHSMRRFRITYLQGKSVPSTLIKFWAGHAAGDISEKYTKFGSQIEERKDWSERAGLGFTL
jgi:integrase